MDQTDTPLDYGAVRLTGSILGGLAFVAMAFGIGLVILVLTERIGEGLTAVETGVSVGLIVLIFGAVSLRLLAYAELINVAVATERNTRRTYELIEEVIEDYLEGGVS